MAIANLVPPASNADMVTRLGHVGWAGLEAYLSMIGDRRGPRVRYREGYLTLVTPSQLHEDRSDRLDGLVKAICVELAIAMRPTGSTLFRRRDLDHGIEADESYYLANVGGMRRVNDTIDLNVCPPPDLMIEVAVTNPVVNALAIFRALRVPEVWTYDAPREQLAFLGLDAAGEYVERSTSRSFPFLRSAEVVPWLESPDDELYHLWESRLRAWVRDVLGPRRAAGA